MFKNHFIVSSFELILPMFAVRKPRRTSSPFKVILAEEKDIICFHCLKNKILAAKLQMFFRFCNKNSEFLFDKVADYHIFGLKEYNFHTNHIALGLKAQNRLARGRAKASPRVHNLLEYSPRKGKSVLFFFDFCSVFSLLRLVMVLPKNFSVW